MKEKVFLDQLRTLAHHPAARGFLDDTAVLELANETLILTHDMMVEGVHFLPDAAMEDVAWKLVATNLSDLAAKGAEPIGVMLGYMLGENDDRFIDGLEDVLLHYNLPLLGGDTTGGGPPRSLGLTAIGRATSTPVPSRSGARPGDSIFVTGELGAAMMGFEALRDGRADDSTAFRRPMARLAEGRLLAPLVTTMMDISDGLLLDAWRMANASNVTLLIDAQTVPIATPEPRRQDALRWGDDYELLFTAAEDPELKIPATCIGTVERRGMAPLFLNGEPIASSDGLGYQHQS